jgi:c-di-GMP-binding flagellar brake protein YcgR
MAREDKKQERRKYARVTLDAYVSASLDTDKAPAERLFISKDMSPEGVFLKSKELFPVGTILKLKIHTSTTAQPINAEAKVNRVATEKNGQVTGMGLVFMRISQKDKEELLKHLYLAHHYTQES